MDSVIIFGTKQFAELAYYYLKNDSKYDVVSFTVNKEFIKEETFQGLPIVPFENIETIYPPDKYKLFAPMSGKGLNKIREKIYKEGKDKGYNFISYISSKATVLTDNIGENCFILEDNTIQPFVKIGNNCVLWSGNHIGHHSQIDDHVLFTSHVVLSGNCTVKSYSWFGVNCTIRDNVLINEGTVIAMSACITKDTESYGMYMGVPGKFKCRSDQDKIANYL